jgi:cell division septal protein FtsQ
VDVKRPQLADPQPFLRRDQHERVLRSRRHGLRRPLAILAALFGVGAGAGLVYAARQVLLGSPRFALHHAEIPPTRHAPQTDLRRVLDRYRGRNLFRLDLPRIERELGACRWVAEASAKRVLPDRLAISLRERVPRGLALLRGRVVLIDEAGASIDVYGEQTREFSFPIFTGLDERDERRAARQAALGIALLDDLDRDHADLAGAISRVDLARDDRIEIHMNDGGPVIRLNPRDPTLNLEHYLAMRDWLATNFGDGAYVDLRFRDRIAFQPLAARGE